jgi:hypothetical protein
MNNGTQRAIYLKFVNNEHEKLYSSINKHYAYARLNLYFLRLIKHSAFTKSY